MSATFTCPNCRLPHKHITVPNASWGVFVSDRGAEGLANNPHEFLDKLGWRKDTTTVFPKAVRCVECGWIGAWPQPEKRPHIKVSLDPRFAVYSTDVRLSEKPILVVFVLDEQTGEDVTARITLKQADELRGLLKQAIRDARKPTR